MAVTLKNIADEAGVSVRTAGRALNKNGSVKAEVADKVREIAERLNYIPNAAARNFKTQQSRIVGVITSRKISSESLRKRIDLLGETLVNNGYYSLYGILPKEECDFKLMLSEWVGLINFLVVIDWDITWSTDVLVNMPFRTIFIDKLPKDNKDKFDILLNDRADGVCCAIEHLVNNGCNKIAHVTLFQGGAGRVEGIEKAKAKLGDKAELFNLTVKNRNNFEGYNMGQLVMQSGANGVFFDTDCLALGFCKYAYENNINIPKDIAIVGFDNDTAGEFAIPSLSSIAHPDEEFVENTMQIIKDGINSPKRNLIFPTKFIARESINFSKD